MSTQHISSLSVSHTVHSLSQQPDNTHFLLDVPLPIVNFSRTVYAATLVLAICFQQPLITSALLFVVGLNVVGGTQWNILSHLGRILFRKRISANPAIPLEDARLIRFNNLIVVGLLLSAQIAFWVAHTPLLGWILIGIVVVASIVALAGYCVGCTIFFRFKLHKFKLFSGL